MHGDVSKAVTESIRAGTPLWESLVPKHVSEEIKANQLVRVSQPSKVVEIFVSLFQVHLRPHLPCGSKLCLFSSACYRLYLRKGYCTCTCGGLCQNLALCRERAELKRLSPCAAGLPHPLRAAVLAAVGAVVQQRPRRQRPRRRVWLQGAGSGAGALRRRVLVVSRRCLPALCGEIGGLVSCGVRLAGGEAGRVDA